MAVTKIWAIKDSLQRVLDYAANPDKTEYDALAQTLHYAENVRTVASLLGHAQASTTLDIYAHAFDKNKRKAQEKLGKAIGL